MWQGFRLKICGNGLAHMVSYEVLLIGGFAFVTMISCENARALEGRSRWMDTLIVLLLLSFLRLFFFSFFFLAFFGGERGGGGV